MCFSTARRPAGYWERHEGGDPFQFMGWKRARLCERVMAWQFSREACPRTAASLPWSCFSFFTARTNPEGRSFIDNGRSDPTRQLSPQAATEHCNKQPIKYSKLPTVAFFFPVYFFGRSNSLKKNKSSRSDILRGFSFWQRH